MTEQRSPDEEPIIELTEVVEPSAAGDDDIIELTDVVESKPTADEDIIELTEIVKSPQVEEEILELVDIVEEAPPMHGSDSEDAATPDIDAPLETEAAQVATPVEDLMEESTATPENANFDLFAEGVPEEAETAAPDNAALDADLDFAPMDLDIEESKEEDLFDSLGMKLEPELQESGDQDALDFNLSTQELSDAIDLLDARLAEEPPVDAPAGGAKAAPPPLTISEAQLERAIENVIRKMFAEKIDLLLNEAIEKNVTSEIEQLKNQLLNNLPEE